MNKPKRTTAASAAAVVAAAFALTACGGEDQSGQGGAMPGMGGSSSSTVTSPSTGTPATGAKNQQDVMFATQMIPHHRQAVEMAKLAASRASSPEVKALAAQIEAAQQPEIERMSGWLVGWGAPVPTGSSMPTSSTGMSGMDMGSGTGSSTPGMSGMSGMDGGSMMTGAEMAALMNAKGAAFDKLFLTSMVKHHQGAVQMAQTQVSAGANTEAKQLAQMIVDTQNKEIDQMKQLLASAGS